MRYHMECVITWMAEHPALCITLAACLHGLVAQLME